MESKICLLTGILREYLLLAMQSNKSHQQICGFAWLSLKYLNVCCYSPSLAKLAQGWINSQIPNFLNVVPIFCIIQDINEFPWIYELLLYMKKHSRLPFVTCLKSELSLSKCQVEGKENRARYFLEQPFLFFFSL